MGGGGCRGHKFLFIKKCPKAQQNALLREAVVQMCSVKKVLLKILQNPQEKISPETLLNKRLWHGYFPVNFVNFLRTPFFQEHFWCLLLTISISYLMSHWNSRPEVLCEKCVPENFTNFTGKHLCQSFFSKRVAGSGLSGVTSNNRFPLNNLVFIFCLQNRLQKQSISHIIFTRNKFLSIR